MSSVGKRRDKRLGQQLHVIYMKEDKNITGNILSCIFLLKHILDLKDSEELWVLTLFTFPAMRTKVNMTRDEWHLTSSLQMMGQLSNAEFSSSTFVCCDATKSPNMNIAIIILNTEL